MARIYIAGPMKGLPRLNFPKFMAVAAYLRELGHEVLNPVEIGRTHFADKLDLPAQEYLIKDIMELMTCDAICLIDGWHNSTGASCEAAIAYTLGMTFYNEQGSVTEPPNSFNIRSYGPRG